MIYGGFYFISHQIIPFLNLYLYFVYFILFSRKKFNLGAKRCKKGIFVNNSLDSTDHEFGYFFGYNIVKIAQTNRNDTIINDVKNKILVPDPRIVYELPFGPAVAVFLLLSAIAHLFLATFGYKLYDENVKKGMIPVRYYE